MARLSGVGAEESFTGTEDDEPQDSEDVPSFFNTTFSTHRVSPLHIGTAGLTDARLEVLARRLRDTLVGDVVRGVQIGLQATETPVGQVGPLKTVKLRRLPVSTFMGDLDDGLATSEQFLWVDIRHENATYAGLLLPGVFVRDNQPKEARGTFLHLPYLLLRMPLPLKNVINDWLAATFDCRISRLLLGTRKLLFIWETWIQTVGFRDNGPDFTLSLAFNAPLAANDSSARNEPINGTDQELLPGLKSVNITIAPSDLRRFVRAGTQVVPLPPKSSDLWATDVSERRRLAGGNADDGWSWRADDDSQTQPFTEALGRYLDHHLALNLFHPSTRIVQISCSGFILGQSRIKILRAGAQSSGLRQAAWTVVQYLGARSESDQLAQPFSTKFDE